MAEWSHALPPCAAQALNSSWQVAVFGSDTPICRAAGQRQVEVLLMQRDAEARIERALDHALAVHLEDLRGGEAAHQRLAHPRRIGPRLGGEQQRLAHRLDGHGDDHLVGDLGRLAGADAADQRDVLAHQLEQRLDLVERRFGLPPTMIDSVAALAPTSPPDTGASR